MTIDDFQDLLDAHGADPDHWPTGLRQTAQAFLEASQLARQALRREQAIEALMRLGDPGRQVDSGRTQAVMAAVLRKLEAPPRPLLSLVVEALTAAANVFGVPRMAASMAAAALLGVVVGSRLTPGLDAAGGLDGLVLLANPILTMGL
ncbi:MAG: hypothetical protein K2X44_03295 [Magnetospirillum sp.]|nr:hypothetical protein [Magnetospirillum sp.]